MSSSKQRHVCTNWRPSNMALSTFYKHTSFLAHLHHIVILTQNVFFPFILITNLPKCIETEAIETVRVKNCAKMLNLVWRVKSFWRKQIPTGFAVRPKKAGDQSIACLLTGITTVKRYSNIVQYRQVAITTTIITYTYTYNAYSSTTTLYTQ